LNNGDSRINGKAGPVNVNWESEGGKKWAIEEVV